MTITITEFGGYAPGPLQVAQLPPIASYTLSVTSDASYSTRPFDPATNYVRVHTDAIAAITAVASTATSITATAFRIPADGIEYFGVKNGNVIGARSTS